RYTVGDTTFTRECFASYPANVIVVRLAADHPGKISTNVSMAREAAASIMASDGGSPTITLKGQITAQYVDGAKRPWGPEKPGMRFEGQARIIASGGSIAAADGALT